MKKQLQLIVYAILALIILVSIPRLVEDVDSRQIVVNQVPVTGTMNYWSSPGLKWQKFGSNTSYQKSAQIWFSNDENEGSDKDIPITIQFNDGGTAQIFGSVRIELPTEAQYLEKIHFKFGSMDNLMNDLIRPTVRKAVLASGPMMTAYESYAEKKNDLMRYIEDQISNGVYQTIIKEVKVKDEISGDEKVIRVAYPLTDSTAINGIKRQELPPFKEFGIRVSSVALNDLTYDTVVKDQIARQQKIMMDMKTSYADALKAKQDAIKEEEMGKAEAAKRKWAQEAIKAEAVTKAQQAFEVAELEAKEAKEKAKKIVAEGEAEAAAARAKVSAGLTPLEKATIEKETKIGVAEAIAKVKLPTVVMSGGGSQGSNSAMDAMGMKMLLDIVDKMSK